MGKVSIGLSGWRFDEEAVFDPDGHFRPLEAMDPDVRDRLLRLTALVDAPCDACWLHHGDEHIDRCRPAAVVYGEPMAEVVLCQVHEVDFLYWYREEGGRRYRGDAEFQDTFHEWFADGGRAPEGYAGLDHVETDPDGLPDPPARDDDATAEVGERIDLRSVDLDAEYPS